MIGNLISMHYIGNKNWVQSFIFWALVFFAGIILSSVLSAAGITVPLISFVLGALLVILLAHYWYRLNWRKSVEVCAVGLVVDVIIVILIFTVLGIGLYGLG